MTKEYHQLTLCACLQVCEKGRYWSHIERHSQIDQGLEEVTPLCRLELGELKFLLQQATLALRVCQLIIYSYLMNIQEKGAEKAVTVPA